MANATFGRRGVPQQSMAPRNAPLMSAATGRPLPSMRDLLGDAPYDDDVSAYAAQRPSMSTGDVAEVDMMRAIGGNWPAYRDLWQDMGGQKSFQFSFSLAAFFFGGFWMLYRKMYGLFFAIFGVTMAISFAAPAAAPFVNLGVMGLLGAFGKSLVLGRHIDMLRRLDTLRLSSMERTAKIERAGGVSWAAPVIFGVILFVLIFFVFTAAVIAAVSGARG